MKKITLLLAFLALSSPAYSSMTIICDEPNGTRTDFYAGDFKEEPDGFAGVKPKFIFDPKKAQQATVLFEPAQLAKQLGFKKTTLNFKVVSQNTNQITLIGYSDTTTTHLYSLYPTLGIGYFTIHRYANIEKGEATKASLKAKCKVLPKVDKK